MRKTAFLSCLVVLGILMLSPAFATEKHDIEIGLKALPLLINKISGDTVMAVVYDPANPTSQSDADAIKKIVDAGVTVPGGGSLSTILISVGELGKLSRVKVAFLTPGLDKYFSSISTATSAASILTISTDINCVKADKCIIGVVTKPDITIYYSKSAADAAKIEFSQAFVMLVKEP